MNMEGPRKSEIDILYAGNHESGTKTYEVNPGTKVKVEFREFDTIDDSEGNESEPSRAIIFMPGWSQSVTDTGIEKISQDFAKNSGLRTIAITSRSEHESEMDKERDVLYEEAEAISTYIEEKGLRDITLAGYSQGGDKAMNIAALLEERSNVAVHGLILIAPVGVYEQEPNRLVRNFVRDSLGNTPPALARALPHKPEQTIAGIRAAVDILGNVFHEVVESKLDFMNRLQRDVVEMAKLNPRAKEITSPIVLISGVDDLVSNPEQIMPTQAEEENSADLEQKDPREVYLQKNLFTKSPYVRMVKPKNQAQHGLPFYRSDKVARVGLGLIERYYRKNSTSE